MSAEKGSTPPSLTERQLTVLRTMCEMVDLDVLDINLEAEGHAQCDLDELQVIYEALGADAHL